MRSLASTVLPCLTYCPETTQVNAALDQLAFDKYPSLTEADVKSLVIGDKWMARLLPKFAWRAAGYHYPLVHDDHVV